MIYAYKIHYLSPRTTIKSYTLFGAFCWGYKLLYGEEKLKKFLEEFKESPIFLISSPFPLLNNKPLFPKPILKLIKEDVDIFQKLKRKPFKKAGFVSEEVFKDFLNGNIKTQNDLMKNYVEYKGIIFKENENIGEVEKKELHLIRNILNRLTSSSENLYFEIGQIVYSDYFLIKFIDKNFKEEFEKTLFIIEDLGLGGNKNIGWGKVKIKRFNYDFSFLYTQKSNNLITLSPIILKENMINNSLYELQTFKSYTDTTFYKPIEKKKVFYLLEGSILEKKEKQDFVGQLKSVGNNIYQYGFEFPIYIKVGEQQ